MPPVPCSELSPLGEGPFYILWVTKAYLVYSLTSGKNPQHIPSRGLTQSQEIVRAHEEEPEPISGPAPVHDAQTDKSCRPSLAHVALDVRSVRLLPGTGRPRRGQEPPLAARDPVGPDQEPPGGHRSPADPEVVPEHHQGVKPVLREVEPPAIHQAVIPNTAASRALDALRSGVDGRNGEASPLEVQGDATRAASDV